MEKYPSPVSVIIPAYNEEKGLAEILPQLVQKQHQFGWEIIVVNDGSNDSTAEVVRKLAPEAILINHKANLGYGASIKSGIRLARSSWIATFDADAQHQISDLDKLLDNRNGYDAVIGMRANILHLSFWRIPGKLILKFAFRIITGQDVKDINCGLRVLKRKVLFKIFGLTCDRFSFSTSSTIALLNLGYAVNFVEINARKRIGKSSVQQFRDGGETILLMLRLITLFNPLRVFLPLAGFLLLLGLVYQITAIFIYGFTVHKSALLFIICGLMLFLFALQQDQISSIRREIASFELDPLKEDPSAENE